MASASWQSGSNARWRPSRLPPKLPVTAIRSPGRAPSRRQARPGGTLPRAVTLTTSGPSQALVSPPASTTPCRAASKAIPSKSPRPIASPPCRGSDTATNAASGRAPIAARSLRLTPRALWPTACGGHPSPSRKSTPSISMSTVTTVRRMAGGRSTAASSPGGTSSRRSTGIRDSSHFTNSASTPIGLQEGLRRILERIRGRCRPARERRNARRGGRSQRRTESETMWPKSVSRPRRT